jgi:UDP-N-acetylglucosamine acyltransferase
MSTNIHPTAIVDSGAEIGDNVEVGPYAIIENNVVIGDGCRIDPQVLIASGARLGREVAVHKGAVLATVPQDLKFGGEETTLEIDDRTVIREYATLNRGTSYHWKTKVGKNCLLMAYSHIAHDCFVGDNVIIGNCTALAGHIEIGEYAIISGLVPVHQFVRIGAHSMVGGGFRVPQDIVPYALCGGYPLKVIGLNLVGLKRRGFAPDVLKALDRAFRIIFRSKFNTSQALTRVKEEVEMMTEVKLLVDFIEGSERGICK